MDEAMMAGIKCRDKGRTLADRIRGNGRRRMEDRLSDETIDEREGWPAYNAGARNEQENYSRLTDGAIDEKKL